MIARLALAHRASRWCLSATLVSALLSATEPFPFAEATIEQLQKQMERGELTSQELTQAYLQRIAEIDRAGPQLRAVIELNPDALAIARERDEERGRGRLRGPLHGIPVLLKDNIATADAMETTAGSLLLVGSKPAADATIVRRLREAGAVLLGKTNLSEWANFRSTRSISGWSSRGGQTRHPYALDRNPSGSSSGSAVAVAANLCVVAVGTETDGSIVSPASANAVVGVKPTVGLVSRAGIIPISVTQDTAGPMARTVRDAAILLEVLAGRDADDAATLQQSERLGEGLMAQLDQPLLRGARLGVLRGPFGFDASLDSVLDEMLEALKRAGAEVIELGEFVPLPEAHEAELEVLLYEFKAGLNQYLQSLGPAARVKSLADAIAYHAAHRDQLMPWFGQELFLEAEQRGDLTEPAYVAARETTRRLSRTEGIDRLLADHRLDALVTLAAGPAWRLDPPNGDVYTGGSSSLAAMAGYPSVTVPAAEVQGLPVGLLFTGPAWAEPKLLGLAADFERHVRARRAPTFPPSSGLLPGESRSPERHP